MGHANSNLQLINLNTGNIKCGISGTLSAHDAPPLNRENRGMAKC